MARPSRRLPTALLLQVLGSLAAIGLLVYKLTKPERAKDWPQFIDAVQHLPWWSLVLAALAIMASRLATAARWHLLLRAVNIRLPIRDSLSLTFAGLFATNVLPTSVGGDVVRLAGAMRKGHSGSYTTASLLLDRVFGLLGVVAAAPFGAAVVSQAWTALMAPRALAAPALTLGEVAAPRGGIIARLRKILRRVAWAFAYTRKHPFHLAGALVMTWGHLAGLLSAIALLLYGLGSPVPAPKLIGLWTIVYLLSLMPFSIGGLGVQEAAITYVFKHFGDVPVPVAGAVAVFVRVMMILASLPGAATAPALMAASKELRPDEAEPPDQGVPLTARTTTTDPSR